MKPILVPSFGSSEKFASALLEFVPSQDDVVFRNTYELPEIALDRFGALLISMHCDQRFLAECAGQIAAFIEGGGTVVANGHFAYPFLPGMTGFHVIPDCHLADLAIVRISDHPIWDGVAAHDLTFRHGVAGFYARVWHEAPAGAQVINGLGRDDRPVDLLHRVGRGRILFHGGNDLWQFKGGDTTAQIVPQLMRWLNREEALQ